MNAVCSAAPAPSSLIGQLLSDEIFRPAAPRTWQDIGLSPALVEALVCKYLAAVGTDSGRGIAGRLCLPFALMEQVYANLRTRQILVHGGAAPLGDYSYKLTETGRDRAQVCERACAYVGAAPVPLEEYAVSVEAQTIRVEATKQRHLREAFRSISAPPGLMDALGPAINSGAGLFLHGAPGNGKSTLARCITFCFGQHIWVPRTLIDDGQLIKFYDPAYHEAVRAPSAPARDDDFDARWIRIRRPTVTVGGELSLEALEIRHDPRSNVS
jgi:predicted ATPase with chaperone activity